MYPPFPLATVPVYSVSVNYVPASEPETNFLSFMQHIDVAQIEIDTREQSSCTDWFKYRHYRCTASKFHGILIRKKLDSDFAKSLLPGGEKPVSEFLKKNSNMEMILNHLLPTSIHAT